MYGIERQEKILSLLSENVSISVAKLSKASLCKPTHRQARFKRAGAAKKGDTNARRGSNKKRPR